MAGLKDADDVHTTFTPHIPLIPLSLSLSLSASFSVDSFHLMAPRNFRLKFFPAPRQIQRAPLSFPAFSAPGPKLSFIGLALVMCTFFTNGSSLRLRE